jgi:c-di-GMP-binding flagellar brake protein YcgR
MAKKRAVRSRERRRMTRADAQLSMRVEGAGADGAPAPVVAESRNISGSGVYCLSPYYLAPLSKVALTIVLPGIPGKRPSQRLLKCEGVVVRCLAGDGPRKDRAYELACSFLNLESSARDRLEEYVVWRNLHALRTRSRPAAAPRAKSRRGTAVAARGAATGAAGRTGARKRRTVH